MFDKPVVNDPDRALKAELDKISWPIEYGDIKIRIRAGKATLLVIEKTVKLE